MGEGPFPSEDTGPEGERIREAGNEYGATTGRPRRCGWFDLLAVRYALELNGADGWIVTNLDVLSGFAEIKVASAYEVGSRRFEEYPAALADLSGVSVRWNVHPGWSEDISAVRCFEDLPAAARAYVEWLEERVGSPVLMVSVGPERDQVIPRAGAPLVAAECRAR